MTDLATYTSLSLEEAFAKLNAVKSPSVDDLKAMVLLEASGQTAYDRLIEAAPNDGVKKLLAKNGQEEMAHAHRVKRAIKILHNEDFPIPSAEDNPFCRAYSAKPVVNKEYLSMLAQGEFAGDAFYQVWASNIGHAEAAKLFLQNGKEETQHGKRAMEAIELLAS